MRITVNQVTHFAIPLLFGVVGSVAGYAVVFFTNAGGLVVGGYMCLRNNAKPFALVPRRSKKRRRRSDR